MNILFLTIANIRDLNQQSVHIDLVNALREKGHNIHVLSTNEKRLNEKTQFIDANGIKLVRLRIGNLTKCSIIEKGISTVLLHGKFKKAIKKYYGKNSYDLVIYNTPPITLANTVKYCKKKYNCKAYLMLKDIFPQNSIDLNILKTHGIKGWIYKTFRRTEKKLYQVSDRIGCMSQANIDYVRKENPKETLNKLEIFPNAVNFKNIVPINTETQLNEFNDKTQFMFGGNLGKPQAIDFLIKGIKACEKENIKAHFIIIGRGTEKERLFNELKMCSNVTTYEELEQNEYLRLMSGCDVGMVMLDHRFTIPNYPSRILSYMQNRKAIFACTDKVTDIKGLIEDHAKCGKWCYSDDLESFIENVRWFTNNSELLNSLGNNGYNYLYNNFNTDACVEKLENFVNNDKEKID